MKLLTLNTHSWVESNQLAKLYQLAETIIAENYDVIALQEVNQLIKSIPVTKSSLVSLGAKTIHQDNFAHLLLEILAQMGQQYYGLWLDCHTGFELYEEGVALLANQPFTESAGLTFRQDLPFSDVRRRSVIGGQQIIDGCSVWFYSGHFSWWTFEEEALFAEEWQAFNDFAQANQGDQAFIMGDFNNDAQNLNEGYPLIRQSCWQDSFLIAEKSQGEHTIEKNIAGWEENQQQLRIDYIFSKEPAGVSQYQVIFDGRHYPQISDHFGISLVVPQIIKQTVSV